MGLKKYKPTTSSRRYFSVSDFSDITASKPHKPLLRKETKTGGHNNWGRQTDVNKGGGHKQQYRVIDFRRDKVGIPGKVATIEYDPNRTARIALIHYIDGEKRYILAPQGLQVGQTISTGPDADIKPGNTLPLKNIPVGEAVHNVELKVGHGGQLIRSAGTSARLVSKEGKYATVRLASGEVRRVLMECTATIGILSNPDHQNVEVGKAGRSRWMGIRPHVRGVAKNPVDHPMGGRTKGGRHPCSRTAIKAKGFKTRENKRTDRMIVKSRKRKGS